jgi:hypothetical protein
LSRALTILLISLLGVGLLVAACNVQGPRAIVLRSVNPTPEPTATPVFEPTATPTPEPAPEVVFSELITVVIDEPCVIVDRFCEQPLVRSVLTNSRLDFEFDSSPAHCTLVRYLVLLDGAVILTVNGLEPGLKIGRTPFGPVSPGLHEIIMRAEPQVGGRCAPSAMTRWGGTVRFFLSAE